MQRFINLFSLLTFLFIVGCTGSAEKSAEKEEKKEKKVEKQYNDLLSNLENEASGTKAAASNAKTMERNGIKLTPVEDSPDFPKAKLTLKSPNRKTIQPGVTNVIFDVENYELGNQTQDAEDKLCANSAKGQHIHWILNNEPYTAHYTEAFEKEFKDGHYVALAFLSRSYHESLKHKEAYQLTQFTVGQGRPFAQDLSKEHLFYSRPKGTYIGERNIEKVMLDFYLVNADLAPNSYRVRATINGTTFVLTDWVPYMMEGLGEGEHTVKLELLDKDGRFVPGPYNSVTRKFTLLKDEPLGN